MKKLFSFLFIAVIFQTPTLAQQASAPRLAGETPRVRLVTNAGDIVVQLNRKMAPQTVDNFLSYVQSGFYSNTVFHRVIPGFMIQGGGFTPEYQRKETGKPIINEANNWLENDRGTLAMARTGNPHSGTAQFFINLKNNRFLNYTAPTRRGWGYAVFGKVVEGMEVVDKIAQIETTSAGPFPKDVPSTTIIIHNALIESEFAKPAR